MQEQAVEKIRTEMQANQNVRYVKIVGEYLLKQIEENPNAAKAVLAEGKTIQGAMAAMRKEAAKVQVDKAAVLTDEEGFGIVLDYFKIQNHVTPNSVPFTEAKEFTQTSFLDISLDDLI